MTEKKDELHQEERTPKKTPDKGKPHRAQEIGRFRHRPLQDYLDPDYDYDDEEDTRRR